MPSTPDIDVSALAEALNEKLDRDGGNATNDIKEMMANMGMPSDKYIDLTLPTAQTSITIPADGYLFLRKRASAVNQFIAFNVYLPNDTLLYDISNVANGANTINEIMLPVYKNLKVVINYSYGGETTIFRLIYAQGSSHLASN